MFCTTAQVKVYANILGSTFDSAIDALCDEISADITKRTGVLTGALSANLDITEQITASTGTQIIQTRRHPINSISKIEVRDSNQDWTDYNQETHANMEFEGDEISAKYQVAPKGRRQIRLTYNAGYLDANIPKDLRLAAIILVLIEFHKRNAQGLSSQQVLDFQVATRSGEEEKAVKIISRYKKIRAY